MDPLNRVVGDCLGTALSDMPWQDMGFKKRPKYGAVVVKWILPQWKIALHRRLLLEFIFSLSAAYIMAAVIDRRQIPELVEMYMGPPGPHRVSLIRAYGFDSVDKARVAFTSGILDYVNSDVQEWGGVFYKRTEISSVPDKKMCAQLIVGSLKFTDTIKHLATYKELLNPAS